MKKDSSKSSKSLRKRSIANKNNKQFCELFNDLINDEE